MERKLKERLAGATVLFLAAVIFIPAILSESPKKQLEKQLIDSSDTLKPHANIQSNIAPTIKDRQQEFSLANILNHPPDAPQQNKAPKVSNKQHTAESQEIAKNPENQTLESKTFAKKQEKVEETSNLPAWVVQLGSFIHEENAHALHTKLVDAGYSSFIESIIRDGKVNYRVRIGPQTKRSDIEALLNKIRQDFDSNAILVSYP